MPSVPSRGSHGHRPSSPRRLSGVESPSIVRIPTGSSAPLFESFVVLVKFKENGNVGIFKGSLTEEKESRAYVKGFTSVEVALVYLSRKGFSPVTNEWSHVVERYYARDVDEVYLGLFVPHNNTT